MKILTYIIIICIIILSSLSVSIFLIFEGLNDDKIIKQQNEQILRDNISFTDNNNIFNKKLTHCNSNVNNLSLLLIKTKGELKDYKKNTNQGILDDYYNSTGTNLCCLRKEQCRDELSDLRFNLSKTLKMYYDLDNRSC